MKKFLLPLCFAFILVLVGVYCNVEQQSKSQQVKAYFIAELNIFNHLKDELLKEVQQDRDQQKVIATFRKCRVQYKKIEFYAEYFYPSSATLLNGPPIDEIELGENMIITPSGLQVIEAYLFADQKEADSQDKLISQINGLGVAAKRMTALTAQFDITDAQIFDALRLSLFRITSLGLSAFDTPESLNVCEETIASLTAISEILNIYGETPEDLSDHIKRAVHYLRQHPYEKLDILEVTVNYLQPIGKSLIRFRNQLHIAGSDSETPLKADVATLFQKDAFNINQFIDNQTQFVTAEKVELGKLLFYDAVLSESKNRSCGSCHQPAAMFTDALTVPISLSKEKLKRNTPTLMYSGYQTAFFYDLNSPTLEDQALNVIHNKNEMGGSLQIAAERLNKIEKYRQAFKRSFQFDTTSYATPAKIQNALAAYIRSLGKFSSDFDRYMQGDQAALTPQQRRGYTLFMGKAKCGSCHFAPLFNGTPPPKFDRTEAEVLGVPEKPDTIRAVIDPDLGRYALNPYPQYKYAFKTPTLRNVARTAPYMHNGIYQTLNEVMDFYNRGGGSGIGVRLENQTLSDKKLHLSNEEKADVIAFLQSLNDH